MMDNEEIKIFNLYENLINTIKNFPVLYNGTRDKEKKANACETVACILNTSSENEKTFGKHKQLVWNGLYYFQKFN